VSCILRPDGSVDRCKKGNSRPIPPVHQQESGTSKTRLGLERYNIVGGSDLRKVTRRQEDYLNRQNGYKTVTISHFAKKEGVVPND